jgi:hypothetical protein
LGFEDDFINLFFFQNIRKRIPCLPEQFSDHGGIAGVLDSIVKGVSDKIEEGLQAGIAGPLCGLFFPLGNLVEECEDLIWGYRPDLHVTEPIVKMYEDELI